MKTTIRERAIAIWNAATTNTSQPQTARVPRVGRTLSSVVMNPDQAMTISAVWACIRYLSQTVAVLPWHAMFRDKDDNSKIAYTHPIDYMLNSRANPEWSSFQFRETLVHWALRWGNGYAEIERDKADRPYNLWPIHPERVDVLRDPNTYELFYEIDRKLQIRKEDMFHIRGFGESPVGVNVITYAAESLGWTKAAQLSGSAFFGNGMNPSAVIKFKEMENPEALKLRRKELDALFKGVRNSSKYLMLDADDEFTQLSIDPQKAQMLETNQFLIEEVCRWFGVPPHKIMHLLRSTFSNIEHQGIEVVVDSISPWAKRFEGEADYKLFGQNRSNYYSKLNLNALMRGDSVSRATWYKTMRDMGVLSANDILRLEDMNTIGPDGDKRVMQSQWTTLEKIGEAPVPAPGTLPSQPSQPSQASLEDDSLPIELRNILLARRSESVHA